MLKKKTWPVAVLSNAEAILAIPRRAFSTFFILFLQSPQFCSDQVQVGVIMALFIRSPAGL
jgi:hypothetical protein